MFRMAAYNISDNTKEPISEDHVKYILRRALDEVVDNTLSVSYHMCRVSQKSGSMFY